jgi:NTE family protein
VHRGAGSGTVADRQSTGSGPLNPRRPRIGLALGSGSARGWSHIGVIRVLERAGVSPDIVCGTSIGSLVGAVYAAGRLDWLHGWVQGLTWQSVVGMLDLKMGGGLIEGGKLADFFRRGFDDQGIERLPKAFGCIATELNTGREVWLREGSVIDAVRASIALPGLFTPAQQEDRLLVDGGLVNPVPVSLCRAMGADVVIAVDLNWDLVGRHNRASVESQAPETDGGIIASLLAKLRPVPRTGSAHDVPVDLPSMLDVLSTSLNIMQVRITQSRLAGEPADAMIRPRLHDIAAMDYHRAAASIAEGERAAEQALPVIADLLETR